MAASTYTFMPTLTGKLGPDLMTACRQNDLPGVRKLTQAHTSSWIDVLRAAASAGSTDVAAYCLEQGATANDFVLGTIMGSRQSEPVYRLLVETGAVDVNFMGLMLGNVVLGSRHSLIEYILPKGADPNSTVEVQNSDSNLACAARWSDAETVRILLDHGARIPDSGALVRAAEEGKLENMRLLLDRGADINEVGVAKSFDFRTFAGLGTRKFYLTTLPHARTLTSGLFCTALHKAIEKDQVEAVELLLERGADTTLRNAQAQTAADIAKEKDFPVEVLAKLETTCL